MKTKMIWAISIVSAGAAPGGALAGGPNPCNFGGCYVNPGSCVVTDKVTLAGLTVDSVISCDFKLGAYCTGGNGTNGLAPDPALGPCGLSFITDNATTPAVALNSLDHRWLQSTTTPMVVDFGSPVNTAFVFGAVDHGPFPEEGIEVTVWGSDACNLCAFPSGWTLGTLTTIWKKGWEDPVACQPGPNSDDFTGQYSFPGAGFRFIAVAANRSISIFDDPFHATWTLSEDNSPVPGWQSFDDEIDAVGTPVCDPGEVVADAGPDQTAPAGLGAKVCFDGSGSVAAGGIATIGWDLNGDSVIDATGDEACIPCDSIKSGTVTLYVTDTCGCVDTDTVNYDCNDPTNRVSISEKGSLLYYSKIELRWTVTAGPPVVVTPRQDTFLTIVNDYPEEVTVQWYFINGDAPLAAVFAGDPLVLSERAHKGWNSVNCTTHLTEDETTYYSAFTGGPLGCQPFTILDPGVLPGRPDPENPGQRVLRGYAIAFAVDRAGEEICWNHLSGHVDIVDYANRSAWEYNAYAFQAAGKHFTPDPKGCDSPLTCDGPPTFQRCGTPPPGSAGCYCAKRPDGTGVCTDSGDDSCDRVSCLNGDIDCPAGQKCLIDTCCGFPICQANCPVLPDAHDGTVVACSPGDHLDSQPGVLHLNGSEYDYAFDKLLFDFYSVGSLAFSLAPSTTVMLDTDLTLYPVSVDLRTTSTNTDGPVITRAKFDVWNQNEDAQSGVNRCITCWDQTLLSNYDAPNSFLIGNIQTTKGKARIDGIESDSCDAPGACCNVDDDPDCTLADLERIEAGGEYDRDCSQNAALLGVSDKILAFSGAGIPAGARTDAGTNLVGQGVQEAVIKRELVDPSDPLTTGLQIPNAGNANGTDDGSLMQIRQQGRDQRRSRPDKK